MVVFQCRWLSNISHLTMEIVFQWGMSFDGGRVNLRLYALLFGALSLV